MSGWSLGPEHPDYGSTARDLGPNGQRRPMNGRPSYLARRTPLAFHCSACGNEKPAARSVCPCGAFARKDGAS